MKNNKLFTEQKAEKKQFQACFKEEYSAVDMAIGLFKQINPPQCRRHNIKQSNTLGLTTNTKQNPKTIALFEHKRFQDMPAVFCISAPAQPYATVVPCIQPCFCLFLQ